MYLEYDKKSSYGWCLYDFANSITVVIGGIYFSKWFIEDLGASSILFNLLFLISAIFIFFTGKWIGSKIDKHGYKKWIIISSFINVLTLLLLFFSSQILHKSALIWFTFPIFLIFLFAYQIARICHNTYFKTIIPEPLQGKMSGYGAASNWAGSIFGIILTIPIVNIYSGSFARELTFLLAAITFGILAVISLKLMFKSEVNIEVSDNTLRIKKPFSLKVFLPSFGLVFLTYFLLFDVMTTVQKNLPSFLTAVHGMTDQIQSYGFLFILLSAMLGGLFSAHRVKKENALKWLKFGSLILGIAITLVLFKNKISLWAGFLVAGFAYGVLESAIRTHFIQSFSSGEAGKNFGQLTAVERSSGIIGPLFWIIPFSLFSNEINSYQISMLFLSFIAFLSFALLYNNKFK